MKVKSTLLVIQNLSNYLKSTFRYVYQNIYQTPKKYPNRKSSNPSKAYCSSEGLPLPEYDYEVLEVWVNGIKKEIL